MANWKDKIDAKIDKDMEREQHRQEELNKKFKKQEADGPPREWRCHIRGCKNHGGHNEFHKTQGDQEYSEWIPTICTICKKQTCSEHLHRGVCIDHA